MCDILSGTTEAHLCSPADATSLGAPVHREVVAPLRQLQREAQGAGFDLQILSGFRSFARQLVIWNDKVTGDRPVLDSDAVPLDIETLSQQELVFAILRWSALPGASRHHWGTDIDVYDASATPQGYEVALIPDEVGPGGIFGPLHAWLDQRIATGDAFGFFRPYEKDRRGVAPERWHLSHAPVATTYLEQLSTDVLSATIDQAALQLKETVLDNLDEIYERFVININRPVT